MIGKTGQNSFSAVGFLFSDRLLELEFWFAVKGTTLTPLVTTNDCYRNNLPMIYRNDRYYKKSHLLFGSLRKNAR